MNLNFEELAFEFQTTNISLTKMAKREGTTRQTLAKYFKDLGIEIINKQNKLRFNENIFDSIDTEEKAYWLGFIYADGNIGNTPLQEDKKSRYTFELSLKGDDFRHLEKFNKFMNYDGNNVKISNSKCNGKIFKRCRWQAANKHLWETLNNLGCIPQKSLILKFPNEDIFIESEKYTKEDLIRHFIRGYFDGDGCISRCIKNLIVSPSISMLGTPEFLNILKSLIPVESIIRHDKRRNAQTVILDFHRGEGIKFINYLYNNASVYLDRKYKLYEFFKDGSRSVKEFTEFQSGNIGETPEMDNPEINSEIKESESSYSVDSEPLN